jgi:hypothetical protein
VGGLTALLAALYVHQGFVFLFFGIPAASGLAMISIRCPRCHQPALKRSTRILGTTWEYWGGFGVPARCSRCGLSFTEDGDADKLARLEE